MSIYLGFFWPRLLFLNGLKRGLKLKISKPKNVFRFKNIIFFDDTPRFFNIEGKNIAMCQIFAIVGEHGCRSVSLW